MITRLYLVRHGATPLSAEDRFAGSENVHLSEEGRSQIEKLSYRLANAPLDAIYCSPLDRAIETANIIAHPHKLTPILNAGISESDHGRWEGLSREEVIEMYPDEYAAWDADAFTFPPQGGESGAVVLARALPAIREIVTKHQGKSVLVVSHKATLRLIISSLLGFDILTYRARLEQAPACLNIFDFKDIINAKMMLYNDISHYADHFQLPQAYFSTALNQAATLENNS